MLFLLLAEAHCQDFLFFGFLSKDAILTSSWSGRVPTHPALAYFRSFPRFFITVLYTFRLVWTVFRGEEN
jgi:NADH:ubiquinone oxidoreductase subunit 5 (subunit L)/multisubunit Na+/H+ antiporter MnhA subunit